MYGIHMLHVTTLGSVVIGLLIGEISAKVWNMQFMAYLIFLKLLTSTL